LIQLSLIGLLDLLTLRSAMMITIYGKTRRESVDYALALDGALIALRLAIKRIEASGECALKERARFDTLQKARAEKSFINSADFQPPSNIIYLN
jgi:hypothetical protein